MTSEEAAARIFEGPPTREKAARVIEAALRGEREKLIRECMEWLDGTGRLQLERAIEIGRL